MPALAIDVLADFDLDLVDDAPAAPPTLETLEVEPLGVSQAVETQRKIEEACARLRSELRAEADDRIGRALDRQAASFAIELDEARRVWVEDEAATLAKALTTAIGEVKARIADAAATALRPFLAEQVREAAIRDLVGQLSRILADPDHPALTVSGPTDLLARVSAALGAEAAAVAFVPADGADIRASVGATLIETRIQAWIDRLNRTGD